MLALISKATRDCVSVVHSTGGYDLALFDVVPAPDNPLAYEWSISGQQFVLRPPSDGEATRAELESDPRWAALKTASGAQVDAWLAANVTDLASARRVLKLLILAVQLLARTR